jgi:hypothetical protein
MARSDPALKMEILMIIRGKTPEWDELLETIDDWENAAREAVETIFILLDGAIGYNFPPPAFMPKLHRILDGCRFFAPDIDVSPLLELSAELIHPNNPPRADCGEWIADKWKRCRRILYRLRARGGTVSEPGIAEPDNQKQASAPAKPEAPQGDSGTMPPEDKSAYVLISTLWDEQFDTQKKCKGFLDKTPSIRTESRGQRFYVHAGDWKRYWTDKAKADFERLDDGHRAPLTPDHTDEMVERILEIQAKKKAGK